MDLLTFAATELRNPLKFGKFFWPDVDFYREQREIILHVLGDGMGFWGSDEVYVPAGNMLG